MSFLYPAALALATLAAAPILLHLLRRETAQRVSFPALRYLRLAERRTSRTMRLRDLILLATRVLLVLLLAVAAARPLAGRGDADDHAPTDVVLLVDNSASMGRVAGDRTLFDEQLEVVREALGASTPSDRFWVVPVVGSPLAAGVDAAQAAAALEQVRLTDAAGDVFVALRDATVSVPVVEDREREAQVYTDLQASGLGDVNLDLSSWGRVAIAVTAGSGPNGAITDLRLEPGGAVVPGAPPSVVGAMFRDGMASGDGLGSDEAGDTTEVRLVVDGETVALVRSTWDGEVVTRLPDMAPGPHEVRLETTPSGLRSDDSRRMGVYAAVPPAVSRSGPGAGFVRNALETLSEAARIGSGDGETIAFLEGPGRADRDASALMLVPPTEATVLPAFNQALADLGVPWRLESQVAAGELGFQTDAGIAGLDLVRVRAVYRLVRLSAPVTQEDSVLVRLEDGAPWAVRGRAGDRSFVLLASALSPEATDLPASVAMLPFIEHALLRWLRPTDGPTGSVEAGLPVTLPPRVESLSAPDGREQTAEGGAMWIPEMAGTWTLGLPDGQHRFIGVNVPARESAVRQASPDEVEALLAGSDVRVVEGRGQWRSAIFGARRGADATLWVVGLLVLLAFVETILRSPRPGGAGEAEAG